MVLFDAFSTHFEPPQIFRLRRFYSVLADLGIIAFFAYVVLAVSRAEKLTTIRSDQLVDTIVVPNVSIYPSYGASVTVDCSFIYIDKVESFPGCSPWLQGTPVLNFISNLTFEATGLQFINFVLNITTNATAGQYFQGATFWISGSSSSPMIVPQQLVDYAFQPKILNRLSANPLSSFINLLGIYTVRDCISYNVPTLLYYPYPYAPSISVASLHPVPELAQYVVNVESEVYTITFLTAVGSVSSVFGVLAIINSVLFGNQPKPLGWLHRRYMKRYSLLMDANLEHLSDTATADSTTLKETGEDARPIPLSELRIMMMSLWPPELQKKPSQLFEKVLT